MTLDEIISALKSSDTTPMAALRAGIAKTDELAPLIFAIADRLCSGVYLLPEENNLLFYGLHIRGVRLALFGKVIKIDCLVLARPFVAHGRERDQSEILTDRVRVCVHEAANCLQNLFRRCRVRMTEFEIVRKNAAHEREGRNNSHAAAAGRTLGIRLQCGHAVWQHGLGTVGVLGERD